MGSYTTTIEVLEMMRPKNFTGMAAAAALLTLLPVTSHAFQMNLEPTIAGEGSVTPISDICELEDEEGTYYNSVSCDALTEAAKALGGTCSFNITEFPSNGECNGKGVCACLWPSDN